MAEEASRVTARTGYKYATTAVLSELLLLLTHLTSYVGADACVSESLSCTTPQGSPEISPSPVCTYSAHCSPNVFSPAVVKWLSFTTHQDACMLQRCDLRHFFHISRRECQFAQFKSNLYGHDVFIPVQATAHNVLMRSVKKCLCLS